MEKVYQEKCLQLILAISKALEQMGAQNYAAAEKTLRDAWREASGIQPETLPLR